MTLDSPCLVCDKLECECAQIEYSRMPEAPEADPAMVQRLATLFAVSLDRFLEMYDGPVSNIDIMTAVHNVFLHMASICSLEQAESEPLIAYLNRNAIVALVDQMRERVTGWDIPTPSSITTH